jgi:hypothetical protein
LPEVDQYVVPVIKDKDPYSAIDPYIEVPKYKREHHKNHPDRYTRKAYDADFLKDLLHDHHRNKGY